MVEFAKFTTEEYAMVQVIAKRAVKMKIYRDRLTADMDISAAHATCPLDLVRLLEADNFNFGHDMAGIRDHLNRETGKLERFFLPRCARPSKA
jgi:hypothetical protein